MTFIVRQGTVALMCAAVRGSQFGFQRRRRAA